MPTITLYGKPGCHLCDEARGVVEQLGAELEFEFEQVDITLDPGLHHRYGERIPVLALDGEELFEFHVDQRELRERVRRAPMAR